MMMSELLEKVQAKAAAAESAAQADYESLVRAAAAGGDLDPDEVIERLAKFKKTPSQFAAAVSTFVRHSQWQAIIDGIPAVTAERNEVERRIAGLVAERDAAVHRFNAQIRSLEAQSSELLRRISEGDSARDALNAERAKRRS